MKARYITIIAFFIIMFVLLFINSIDSFTQDTEDIFGKNVRAAKGEEVMIIYNHVKADKREQFEKFIEVWRKCIEDAIKQGKFNETEIKAITGFRYLTPTRQNRDSTYTYVYLVDPWFGGLNTSERYQMTKTLSEEEAEKYIKMWRESLARGQESYTFFQSDM